MKLDRRTLEQHSMDMRQFIGARQSTLPNGMQIIDVYNSSGLRFTLLPDRGLDIWLASFQGQPLTWISNASPHPPDAGSGWLQQFNGGLLTTCGLQHAGPAETDDVTGEKRDVHGQFTRLPAQNVHVYGGWTGGHDAQFELYIEGDMYESALFGPQLHLHRRYRIVAGKPIIELIDTVTNRSDTPLPLMVLYHVNLGYPLIRDGTTLHLPVQALYPRDAAARAGAETWPTYESPTAGYPEQVFFHHLKMQPNSTITEAFISNQDIGLRLQWDSLTAPYFTQWKNTRSGIYVCGIEPGNCVPEGQNAARSSGRLVVLAAGEHIVLNVRFEMFAAPQTGIDMIEQLQMNGRPVHGSRFADFEPYE